MDEYKAQNFKAKRCYKSRPRFCNFEFVQFSNEFAKERQRFVKGPARRALTTTVKELCPNCFKPQ